MGTRAIWAGAISFGPVNIPVKLYAATEDQEGVSFRQVHREDGGRIQFRRFCSIDGAEVPYSEIAKGLEWGDNMLIFTDEDMASLPIPTSKNIEVKHFCGRDEVDPMLYGKSYFLLPDNDGANKAYALMAGALGGKAGIAKVALRQRERLCMVTVRGGVLLLTILLWPEEVRDIPAAPDVTVGFQEEMLAAQLVTLLTEPFQPAEHSDGYKAAVHAIAEHKAAGTKPVAPEVPTGADQAMSLIDTLAAAVEAAKEGKK